MNMTFPHIPPQSTLGSVNVSEVHFPAGHFRVRNSYSFEVILESHEMVDPIELHVSDR